MKRFLSACVPEYVCVFVDIHTFCAARCRAVLWLWSVLLTEAPAFSRISAQSRRSARTQYIKGVRPNWSSRSLRKGSATHTHTHTHINDCLRLLVNTGQDLGQCDGFLVQHINGDEYGINGFSLIRILLFKLTFILSIWESE